MNEIEKLYENAGVKPLCQIPDGSCGVKNVYEDFTAEKQLELIKWLCKTGRCLLRVVQYTDTNNWYMQTLENISSTAESFEESLAGLINNLWQDLTAEEQQQIKEILQ